MPLLGTEQLAGGRLPFFDACKVSENNCDEYPVLTMYLMRVAAWVRRPTTPVSTTRTRCCCSVCALATGAGLWLLVGRRALWFALAPTLLIYGTMNWDLFAVALATGAFVAWASGAGTNGRG